MSDTPTPTVPYPDVYAQPVLRRRFENRIWLHVSLFVLTLVTTTAAGVLHYAAFVSDFGRRTVEIESHLLPQGLWYSVAILLILGAHEMGHYLACRYHDVDASLPYFIPFPVLTGTLGAVIRIRQRFPTKRILFDIGVMGPLAGFAVLVPILVVGLHLSTITANPTIATQTLGEPLLFKLAARTVFGPIPDGYALNMHPMVFAAWFGMLATALNLLPFGQLDGGHLTSAALGRWARIVSILTFVCTAGMAIFASAAVWAPFVVLMAIMLKIVGLEHPPVIDDREPLDAMRRAIGLLALVVFVICLTPTPIGEPSLSELLVRFTRWCCS